MVLIANGMFRINFQQALQSVQSDLFSTTCKLFLPKCEDKKGACTPYLRRRMRGKRLC